MEEDPAGGDEQRSDPRDEAQVVGEGLEHAVVADADDVVGEDRETQAERDVRIVLLPPVPVDERHHGDRQEQDEEGQDHPAEDRRHAGFRDLCGRRPRRDQESKERDERNPHGRQNTTGVIGLYFI